MRSERRRSMIFHEMYGYYYQTVARILTAARNGRLTQENMVDYIREGAFSESALTILPALKEQKWPLLDEQYRTPLKTDPTMPLTTLEKRWLKAIAMDPRIKLFRVEFPDLGDVEPLFTPDDYVVYDRYNDGDPYEDNGYIHRFHMILDAMERNMCLRISYLGGKGGFRTMVRKPIRLEYSEKDDKFRLLTAGRPCSEILNVARITGLEMVKSWKNQETWEDLRAKASFTMELIDERNVLERAMMHFAHFEKQTERVEGNRYRTTVWYDPNDESELVIRVLSFGPLVKVTEPTAFVQLIRNKLLDQWQIDRKNE